MNNLRILLIIEQCNPDWASVPLVGYHFYQEISQLTRTTLVTHQRNQPALQAKHPDRDIIYISESGWIPPYYQLIDRLTSIGRKNWPLHHTLSYPIYQDFNQKVYQKFKNSVMSQSYDIVHVITPMMPRYPVKLIKACHNTPFIMGPVNGGVPFPSGFQEIANQEFAFLNFLRKIG
ncbi:MAG: glycosyltransferase family 1 protein, partial [Microcystaceae cyanobacterium]